MKNTSSFPVLIIPLSIFLFAASSVSAQLEPYKKIELSGGNVQIVAARIATLYNVNASIVEPYVQAAVSLESGIGIAAPVVIAIAIHESSFKSPLFAAAGNPFGIKADKSWEGSTFSKWHDGKVTKFRVYESAEAAVLDFGNFVKSRKWYADALSCPMDDYPCVVNGLRKTAYEPGYSLNPKWDEAILGIIEKFELQTVAVR